MNATTRPRLLSLPADGRSAGNLVIAVLLIALASTTSAAIVTIDMTGETQAGTTGNIFDYDVGDEVSFSLTYDTDATPSSSFASRVSYPATATMSFGSHTFSGAATLDVGTGSFGRVNFTVTPLFDPADPFTFIATPGGSSAKALGPGANYTGPVTFVDHQQSPSLTDLFAQDVFWAFRQGGFSLLDVAFPEEDFPGLSLGVPVAEDIRFASQNGAYYIPSKTEPGRVDLERIAYRYDRNTVSISVLGVPEPTALSLGAACLMVACGVRVRSRW